MTFKEGDWVVLVKDSFPGIGRTGVVVGGLDQYNDLGVRWDDWYFGHDCNGSCGSSGWYVPTDFVKLAKSKMVLDLLKELNG